MAASVEDLTVNYTDAGVQTVKELDKVILSKGAWATVIFKYQDLDRTKGEFGPEKYTIRRYQKRNNEYMTKSKFNISSKDQAQKIIEALQNWIGE
ncbi:MAG: hypothetical protein FD165_1599 [Gammaproteobacteria bacterium]|nr:MAG: hypothetical protein FD165_1599 [Gammaproteobacteria bacterium]TND05510.1 MAG: hypothetical protein FD120_1118 [Gammaproteobacteria bacterium]